MPRRLIKLVLITAAVAAFSAAAAAPMSATDYAKNAMREVEYQNLSCNELEELEAVLEELRGCGPPNAASDPSETQYDTSLPARYDPFATPPLITSPDGSRLCVSGCTIGIPPSTRAPGAAVLRSTNPDQTVSVKTCSIYAPPVHKLTHSLYDALGPTALAALKTIGVDRDMDYPRPAYDPGIVMPMQGSRAVITSIESPIIIAKRLKNCRI